MITHHSRQVFTLLDLVIICTVALMVGSATLVKSAGMRGTQAAATERIVAQTAQPVSVEQADHVRGR
jgi:hypothetical protein